MTNRRKNVKLTVEGTDLLISIFPEDGEVRVTSNEYILNCGDDGKPRHRHTLVVTRADKNPDCEHQLRRPDFHVTLEGDIRAV
ncbi:hypothetical protein [Nocardia sp. NPDC004711]